MEAESGAFVQRPIIKSSLEICQGIFVSTETVYWLVHIYMYLLCFLYVDLLSVYCTKF